MNKINIGIVGYGNIGRGVAKAVNFAPDMELKAIFTRREIDGIKNEIGDSNVAVLSVDDTPSMIGKIDVMILCGGTATDLPSQGPYFASMFNVVDSYDKHAKIPEYLASIDTVAKNTTAIISTGWDPGLFSIMRSLFESVLPDGADYTFWGKGVSQGHSVAVRSVEGVSHAVQYSIPIDSAIEAVRSGERPQFTTREKHKRDCYVVAKAGADKDKITETIKNMPDYFADYDTTVNFIELDEFLEKHTNMPHGGMVLRSGNTSENKQHMEFSLKLDSNPEFTGSIMTAYARAAHRLSKDGIFGAKTVYDVPLSYLSARSRTELIKELL